VSSFFSNSPNAALFAVAYFAWVLSELVGAGILPFLRQRGNEVKVRADRGSRFAIFLGLSLAIVVGIVVANHKIGPLPATFFYGGVALMFLGIVIRQWAIAALGRFFSLQVRVIEGQRMVTRGPYRLVRHPSYTGVLLTFAGFGSALESWAALAVMLAIFALVFGYRIAVEERTLQARFGKDYEEYMKRTKRLIPFVV
jgi:protein-S-isoprenylcysteine O-methyltransferase Ste14